MPDGSLAPYLPIGFIDKFVRMMSGEGIVCFLKHAIAITRKETIGTDAKFFYNTKNGLYDEVVVYWASTVSIEGFLYATRTAVEELTNTANEILSIRVKMLYNQLLLYYVYIHLYFLN